MLANNLSKSVFPWPASKNRNCELFNLPTRTDSAQRAFTVKWDLLVPPVINNKY